MVMKENKFRKQSRDESQTKIEDEVISPYVIYFDGVSYTVVKPKEKGQDGLFDDDMPFNQECEGMCGI